MRQVKVGTYECSGFGIDVYGRSGDGADFCSYPEHGRLTRIKIGMEVSWPTAVGYLVHEAMELMAHRLSCRYEPANGSLASDRFVFHMNHYQFSEACDDVGRFMAQVLPDLATVWNRKYWKR